MVKSTDDMKVRVNALAVEMEELMSQYSGVRKDYIKLCQKSCKDIMSKIEEECKAIYSPQGHKVFNRKGDVYINWKGVGGPTSRQTSPIKQEIELGLGESGVVKISITKANGTLEAKQLKVSLTEKYKKSVLNIPSWAAVTKNMSAQFDKYFYHMKS